MNNLLTDNDLSALNRLLEWVSMTRLAAAQHGRSSVNVEHDQSEEGWRVTAWVHLDELNQCRRFSPDARAPSFIAGVVALLNILPDPVDAGAPERAADTEPHNLKPSEQPGAWPSTPLVLAGDAPMTDNDARRLLDYDPRMMDQA